MLDAATRKPLWRHNILDADGICCPGEYQLSGRRHKFCIKIYGGNYFDCSFKDFALSDSVFPSFFKPKIYWNHAFQIDQLIKLYL